MTSEDMRKSAGILEEHAQETLGVIRKGDPLMGDRLFEMIAEVMVAQAIILTELADQKGPTQ
jgi:hypothetical protein